MNNSINFRNMLAKKKHFYFIIIALTAMVVLSLQSFPVLAQNNGNGQGANNRVTICHVAGTADNPANHVTLTLPQQALRGHFDENGTPLAGHEDDYVGECHDETRDDHDDHSEEPVSVQPSAVPSVEADSENVAGQTTTTNGGQTQQTTSQTANTPSGASSNPEETANADTTENYETSLAVRAPQAEISVFDPSLSKIGYLPQGGLGLVGEDLTWEVTVTNDSAVAETNIIVTDILRDELQVNGVTVSDPATMTPTITGQQVDVAITTLAAGASVQFFIDTTVISAPADNQIDNTVVSGGESATAIVPMNRSICTTGTGSATDLLIDPVHDSDRFYVDTDATPQQNGMYVGYSITNNTGQDVEELYVTLDNFTGTVGLGNLEDGETRVGFLAAGESTTVYFYLAVPDGLNLNNGDIVETQDFKLNAFEGEPSGAGQLCSYDDSFGMIDDTIRANANNILTVTGDPLPPVLGGDFNITITGNTGNVGAFEDCLFQTTPATFADWDADSFELVGVEVIFYDYPAPGQTTIFNDLLSIENVCGASADYEVIYTFHVNDIPDTGTSISPSNNVASGNQIKHQDPDEDPNANGPFIPVPINNAVIEKTVNPTELVLGGTATYSISLTNAGAAGDPTITLHEVLDILPSTPDTISYISGTSTLGGVPIPDPAIDGQNLEWRLFVDIPATETIVLTYDVTVPATGGLYTNTAIGGINAIQIDTTIPTDDDVPATADILVLAPNVAIEKIARTVEVNEPGADVIFDILVTNTGTVELTLDSLSDDMYGDITVVAGDISATTCSVPQTIAVNGTYTCNFTAFVDGNAGDTHTNVVTVEASGGGADTTANDDESVDVLDVLPTVTVAKTPDLGSVPETGGDVTFTVRIDNTSVEPITVNSIIDDLYGNIPLALDPVTSTDCAVPQVIAVSGFYECSFTVPLSGNTTDTHVNVITVNVTDDEGNTASDDDDATVTYTDVPPTITVLKTPNLDSVPETGGDVIFTVEVTNTSQEAVTITDLIDSDFGDLITYPGSTCTTQVIAAGATYSCTFPVTLSGNTTDLHQNTVTATVVDDDGTTASDDDDAEVSYTNVAPTITVLKTANVAEVPETGGDVTFTVEITNTSAETVTITSLVDSDFGDLTTYPGSTCATGETILAGDTYTCTFTATLSGDVNDPHQNTVTVTVEDDENTSVTESDDETVDYVEVLPQIAVTKTPNVTEIPETGGSVVFTVLVENIGQEDVTLNLLSDNLFGDITTVQGDVTATTCSVPQAIAIGNSYTCDFTATVSGNFVSGTPHQNIVTATASDDDGNTDTETGTATVPFTDVLPTITVSKVADANVVPEIGGSVTFTLVVENTSDETVTLTSLVDSDFGDSTTWTTTDCVLPQTLAPSATYTCEFTEILVGDPAVGHQNTITATANDDEGNDATATDTEDVAFSDSLPAISVTKIASNDIVPETGALVTFNFEVFNESNEGLTLTSLVDSEFGDLSAACGLPVSLIIGASIQCSFQTTLSGNTTDQHSNTVTATANDDDGNDTTATATETVDFADVLPTITVSKTPNVTSVPETGGDVTFTVQVNNTSLEDITLTSLVDSDFGDLELASGTTCALPQIITAGGSYSCEFTVLLSGNTTDQHQNTVTATANDDEDNTVTAEDIATVDYDDVLPVITVVKTPNLLSVPETGGDVIFTVEVTNETTEAVEVISLTDSLYGDLTLLADSTCTVPQTLAGGTSYLCMFMVNLSGEPTAPHQNIVTANATDDEGNTATDSDTADVGFDDVLPDITLVKDAGLTNVPQTGGDVTYTVQVTNNSTESVTLTALSDNLFGDITQIQGDVSATDCALNQIIAAGGMYTCSFTAFVSGTANTDHVNIVTGTVTDNENNTDTASDDATVAIDAEPGVMVITKTTTTPYVPIGGNASFLITANNPGPVEITNVTVDDDLCTVAPITNGSFNTGDVDSDNILDVGETWQFSCTVTGATASMVNQATGTGTDENGDPVTDTDSDAFTSVGLQIVKTASATSINSGEDVIFTLDVSNTGDAPMSNINVSDPMCTPVAVLNVAGTANIGDVDADNQLDLTETWRYTCTVTGITADVTNIATVTGTAPDNTPVSDSDTETVTVNPIPPVPPTPTPDAPIPPAATTVPSEETVTVAATAVPVVEVDAETITRLPELGDEEPVCTLDCVPWMMYHTDETGDWEIFRMGDSPEEVYADSNVSRGTGAQDFAPTRSPDGQWVAFASDRDGNWEIYVSSADGTNQQRMTYNSIAHDTNPVWGPNNWIIYESTRNGNWDLYMFDVTTGQETRLTDEDANDMNAFWSPNGNFVLFQSDRDGIWQIYELNLTTLNARRITDADNDYIDPQYSPDGTQITYRSYDDTANSEIYLLNRRNNEQTIISDAGGNASQAAFSPDGSLLSYQSDLDGDLDIYVYDVVDDSTRQVTDNDVPDYAPSWLCGGTALVYTSEVTGNPDIFTADVSRVAEIGIAADDFSGQLTTSEDAQIYPQYAPSDEDASREGRLPLSPVDDRLPAHLRPDVSLTALDTSEISSTWIPIQSCVPSEIVRQ